MNNIIIGIDPGMSGAIAVVSGQRLVEHVHDVQQEAGEA